MYCSKCGKKIEKREIVCKDCGCTLFTKNFDNEKENRNQIPDEAVYEEVETENEEVETEYEEAETEYEEVNYEYKDADYENEQSIDTEEEIIGGKKFMIGLLSFLFPIIGFIFYFYYKKSNKKIANFAGMIALISYLFNIIVLW